MLNTADWCARGLNVNLDNRLALANIFTIAIVMANSAGINFIFVCIARN